LRNHQGLIEGCRCLYRRVYIVFYVFCNIMAVCMSPLIYLSQSPTPAIQSSTQHPPQGHHHQQAILPFSISLSSRHVGPSSFPLWTYNDEDVHPVKHTRIKGTLSRLDCATSCIKTLFDGEVSGNLGRHYMYHAYEEGRCHGSTIICLSHKASSLPFNLCLT
jgi:hypothetical protein